MRLAPHAKVDDGKMDVVIVRRASRRQMLHLFRRVFDGSHVHMPFVEYYQVRSMKILTDDRRPLDIDGEIRGTPPVSGDVLPGAVRIYL
jgi:diacylglycerol kinase family enzyme